MRQLLKKKHGYTLVEMIFVVAIIAILSVFATGSWQGTGISLVAEASQLVNDIRYTQALSMSKNQRYRLVITSSNSYRILNAAGTAIMMANGATTVNLSTNTTFGSITNLPNSLVAFNTLGVPFIDTTSPGTPLSSTATIALVNGTQSRAIAITPNTGRVIMQ